MPVSPLLDIVAEGRYFSCVRLARPLGKKTDTYAIVAKADCLIIGDIRWYGAWRKYALFVRPETVWEETCLAEVASVLKRLTQEQRRQRRSGT
jgi:hypothetical protein